MYATTDRGVRPFGLARPAYLGRGTPDHDLTVIIPACNEEHRLPATVAELRKFLDGRGLDYRVLISDDGSQDRTATLAQRYGDRFSTPSLSQHGGKGMAVRTAILQATDHVLVFSDADLPYDLSSLRKGYENIREGKCQVVFGSRALRESANAVPQRWSRRLSSCVLRAIARRLVSREVGDTQCGLKLFSRRAPQEIFSRAVIDGFVFDTEVVWLAQHLHLPFEQIPVRLIHDHESSLNTTRHAIPMFLDVLRLWRRAHHDGGKRPENGAIRRGTNCRKLGNPASMAKQLVIHADDLAMSVSTNLAILESHVRGLVASASLMTNLPALDHAAEQFLRPTPRLGADIHLCLTCGRPVLAASEVPLLVDGDGRFRHGFVGLTRLIRSRYGDDALVQIAQQWQAQATRIDAGRIAIRRKLAVRFPDEATRFSWSNLVRLPRQMVRGNLFKKMLLSRFARESRRAGFPRVSRGPLLWRARHRRDDAYGLAVDLCVAARWRDRGKCPPGLSGSLGIHRAVQLPGLSCYQLCQPRCGVAGGARFGAARRTGSPGRQPGTLCRLPSRRRRAGGVSWSIDS